MKVYTKTGDRGTTALVGGVRVSKSSPRLEAYGTVDELNSHLGLLAAIIDDPASIAVLHRVQNRLFNLGAYLATPTPADPLPGVPAPDVADSSPVAPVGIGEAEIAELESEIDRLDATLPPLTCFILPGGTPEASQANIARTVCRRAERRIIDLTRSLPVHPLAIAYINRLSDYLFTLGRHLNNIANTPELPWQP